VDADTFRASIAGARTASEAVTEEPIVAPADTTKVTGWEEVARARRAVEACTLRVTSEGDSWK